MFQFTHPGRGATRLRRFVVLTAIVSIHAPREGCDRVFVPYVNYYGVFQFTHPGRGATPKPGHDQDDTDVSIHAPREGCDIKFLPESCFSRVSIHAPREGCDGITLQAGNSAGKFQFTHPGRGAT